MDVNDLKSLYAEVNTRMNTSIEHVRHELAGVRVVLSGLFTVSLLVLLIACSTAASLVAIRMGRRYAPRGQWGVAVASWPGDGMLRACEGARRRAAAGPRARYVGRRTPPR